MKTLLRLSLIILIFAAGLCLSSHYLMELNSAKTLSQVILKYHPLFTLWRYGLYALVLIIWPYFIEKVGTKQKWSAQSIVYLSNQRVKLLGFFVFIEAFFVYNLLGHLLTWLF